MGLYSGLSTTDKAIVDNVTNLIRGAVAEMAGIWNRIKAIADDTNATGLVVGLDNGEIIPNTSGLGGADDLTEAEVITLFNLLNGIRTTNDTTGNRNLMSRAAGINAMMEG